MTTPNPRSFRSTDEVWEAVGARAAAEPDNPDGSARNKSDIVNAALALYLGADLPEPAPRDAPKVLVDGVKYAPMWDE
jgi:hypothetical protein